MLQLSVITINFNNAAGLEKTIASIVNQSYQNFELIVIDGASNDGSVDVIKKYADKIKCWVSEKDNGIYDAQNKGIDKATGEYCLFLNSGDYLANPDALKNAFSAPLQADIVACDMIFDYGNKQLTRQQPDSISFFYMMDTSIWHPATFIKRTLFHQFGKYNLNFKIAADYDFFLKALLVKNATFFHKNTVLSVFDTSGVSSNSLYLDKRNEERLQIQKQSFSQQLISDAFTHNQLVKSNSFKVFTILKKNPIVYQSAKGVFTILIGIKRLFNKSI